MQMRASRTYGLPCWLSPRRLGHSSLDAWFSLRHLVQRRRAADDLSKTLASLTSRELDVYQLAARGLGREQIARTLFISPDTVRTLTLQKIYGKLGFIPVRNWRPFLHMVPLTI